MIYQEKYVSAAQHYSVQLRDTWIPISSSRASSVLSNKNVCSNMHLNLDGMH